MRNIHTPERSVTMSPRPGNARSNIWCQRYGIKVIASDYTQFNLGDEDGALVDHDPYTGTIEGMTVPVPGKSTIFIQLNYSMYYSYYNNEHTDSFFFDAKISCVPVVDMAMKGSNYAVTKNVESAPTLIRNVDAVLTTVTSAEADFKIVPIIQAPTFDLLRSTLPHGGVLITAIVSTYTEDGCARMATPDIGG